MLVGIILLFYKYVQISNLVEIQTWQKQLCADLGLTGRVLLAHEGINGTLGGTQEATDAYIAAMNQHFLFGGIDFKTSPGGSHAFPRCKIVIKKEIVHLGINPEDLTVAQGGQHLTPEQTHDLLSNPPEDLVILDTRNTYESAVGKFAGALVPDIRYFRQFPEYIDKNIDQFKDKTVLMYCTGGVRCERATSVLNVKNVAKKVYQVEGGIHRYVEKFPNGFFRGANYVFDQRVTVKINNDVLGACLHCSTPSDVYFNCLNAFCNKHFTSCQTCVNQFAGTCGQTCKILVQEKKTQERVPFQKI